MKLLVCLVTVVGLVQAQEIKLPPSIEKLGDKAEEVVDVTLDASMLGLASKFLDKDDKDQAKAKKIVSGLNGIFVRSFEFAKEGEYSVADVETLRSQYKAPMWTRMVGVRSRKNGEHTDIFVKRVDEKVAGMAIIAAEPKELTIVHISGNIDLEQLGELGGQFGIPDVGVERKALPKPEPKPAK